MYALLQVTCQVERQVSGVVHLCGVAPVVRESDYVMRDNSVALDDRKLLPHEGSTCVGGDC